MQADKTNHTLQNKATQATKLKIYANNKEKSIFLTEKHMAFTWENFFNCDLHGENLKT